MKIEGWGKGGFGGCFELVVFCGCFLSGFFSDKYNLFQSGWVADVYSVLDRYFPFSYVEKYISHAAYPAEVRGQLVFLWLSFPLFFFFVARRSSRHFLRLRFGGKAVLAKHVLIYLVALSALILNFLIVFPEPSFCRGCEYSNRLVGICIRWMSFWAVGYYFGQLVAVVRHGIEPKETLNG